MSRIFSEHERRLSPWPSLFLTSARPPGPAVPRPPHLPSRGGRRDGPVRGPVRRVLARRVGEAGLAAAALGRRTCSFISFVSRFITLQCGDVGEWKGERRSELVSSRSAVRRSHTSPGEPLPSTLRDFRSISLPLGQARLHDVMTSAHELPQKLPPPRTGTTTAAARRPVRRTREDPPPPPGAGLLLPRRVAGSPISVACLARCTTGVLRSAAMDTPPFARIPFSLAREWQRNRGRGCRPTPTLQNVPLSSPGSPGLLLSPGRPSSSFVIVAIVAALDRPTFEAHRLGPAQIKWTATYAVASREACGSDWKSHHVTM